MSRPRSLWNGTIAFVAVEQIDPVYYDKPYVVGAQDGGERAYRVLLTALKRSGKVGIGRFVLRTREQLVALRPRGRALVLHTMRFADEDRRDLRVPPHAVPSDRRSAPRRREVDEALRVIDAMTRDFDPGRYEDCHRRRLLRLIQRKRRGGKIEIPDVEPEPDPVPDLMAALEASLARVGTRA